MQRDETTPQKGDDDVAHPIDWHGSFTDLGAAKMEAPDFIIDEWLCSGMMVVGGPPKSLKSTVVMALVMLASGNKCNVLPPLRVRRTGQVQLYSFEASAGELRYMVEKEFGATVPADESIMVCDDPWTFRIDAEEGIEKLLYWLNDTMPLVVVLDPLRNFHNLDENDSGAIIAALEPVRKWAKDNKRCAVIVHHAKKREEGRYNTNDLRGSSALFGMVDGALIISREGETEVSVSATFKRGQSWERSIELAAYGNKDGVAGVPLGEMDRTVYKLLKAGATNTTKMAKQLKCSKSMVIKCLRTLEANRMVEKRDNKWKAVKRK